MIHGCRMPPVGHPKVSFGLYEKTGQSFCLSVHIAHDSLLESASTKHTVPQPKNRVLQRFSRYLALAKSTHLQ